MKKNAANRGRSASWRDSLENLVRNLKKVWLSEPVFHGSGQELDIEEMLLDSEGDVEFATEDFNPFGRLEQQIRQHGGHR
ncbi:MAG: hypothetical protein ABEJ07_02345 [Candidatus Nanohaloarchaea archaeon]